MPMDGSRKRKIFLLDQDGRRLACRLGSLICEFLQLLGAHLAEVAEKEDKRELDALLGHHEETLDKQTLEDLRADALEKGHGAFVLNNVLHDFCKGFEGLAVPGRRGF